MSENKTIETRETDKGRVDRRRHECVCGIRWTSRAVLEPGSIINTTGSVIKRRYNAIRSVEGKPPDAICSAAPPTYSVGGVGGGVPSGQVVNPVSDPVSISFLLSNPDQTRARTKKQAKAPTDFTRCRDVFVGAWEEVFGEPYPFEAKDGMALAAMLKTHPEYGEPETWDQMIGRYFADEFYGRKRHPLVFLASKAREFAGTARNGVPQRIADSRDTARSWARRNAG